LTYTTRSTCRACQGIDLHSVLDLGNQPLANGFRKPEQFGQPETRYPLHLVRCGDCELVQLSGVVDPKIMYGGHYPYRSGFSEGWALHCHDLAKEIGKGKRVLEIGCLDGVMLRHCRDNGCLVWGVDPSSPVIDLPVYREFFGRDWVPGADLPTHDVIVAQNVFGHVDDAKGFLEGVLANLAPNGTCIIECPWVVDLIDGVEWDTVYHEHLSYWGVRPLARLAKVVGLEVTKVKYFQHIHGGTMRYYLSPATWLVPDPTVYATWADEEMGDRDWKRFLSTTYEQIGYWDAEFKALKTARVAAYGASAKLNTFLNALPERPPLTAVFDDNPTKIGLLTPGWGFQVLAPLRDRLETLDVLLVGAPNWIKDIEAKARTAGFKGDVRSLWQ
jgi:SAM-dependent methyltransferase